METIKSKSQAQQVARKWLNQFPLLLNFYVNGHLSANLDTNYKIFTQLEKDIKDKMITVSENQRNELFNLLKWI